MKPRWLVASILLGALVSCTPEKGHHGRGADAEFLKRAFNARSPCNSYTGQTVRVSFEGVSQLYTGKDGVVDGVQKLKRALVVMPNLETPGSLGVLGMSGVEPHTPYLIFKKEWAPEVGKIHRIHWHRLDLSGRQLQFAGTVDEILGQRKPRKKIMPSDDNRCSLNWLANVDDLLADSGRFENKVLEFPPKEKDGYPLVSSRFVLDRGILFTDGFFVSVDDETKICPIGLGALKRAMASRFSMAFPLPDGEVVLLSTSLSDPDDVEKLIFRPTAEDLRDPQFEMVLEVQHLEDKHPGGKAFLAHYALRTELPKPDATPLPNAAPCEPELSGPSQNPQCSPAESQGP